MIYSNLFIRNKKLDFVVIGAQKAGTTAMYHYLNQNSNIELPKIKELHFFDDDNLFAQKKINYSLINKHFTRSTEKIRGEVTPSYIYWNPCIERIYNYNPEIKLIAILRNPITRAFSHWNHEIEMRTETRSFIDCINDEMRHIQKTEHYQHKVRSYISRGLYSKQIEKIFTHFKKQQVLFIKYEEFLSNQFDTVTKVTQFLGASQNTGSFKEDFTKNYKPYKKNINAEEKVDLLDIFKADIRKTEKLLDWKCQDWLNI